MPMQKPKVNSGWMNQVFSDAYGKAAVEAEQARLNNLGAQGAADAREAQKNAAFANQIRQQTSPLSGANIGSQLTPAQAEEQYLRHVLENEKQAQVQQNWSEQQLRDSYNNQRK